MHYIQTFSLISSSWVGGGTCSLKIDHTSLPLRQESSVDAIRGCTVFLVDCNLHVTCELLQNFHRTRRMFCSCLPLAQRQVVHGVDDAARLHHRQQVPVRTTCELHASCVRYDRQCSSLACLACRAKFSENIHINVFIIGGDHHITYYIVWVL